MANRRFAMEGLVSTKEKKYEALVIIINIGTFTMNLFIQGGGRYGS